MAEWTRYHPPLLLSAARGGLWLCVCVWRRGAAAGDERDVMMGGAVPVASYVVVVVVVSPIIYFIIAASIHNSQFTIHNPEIISKRS